MKKKIMWRVETKSAVFKHLSDIRKNRKTTGALHNFDLIIDLPHPEQKKI